MLFVSISLYTGLTGAIKWHLRSGYCVLALVLFRIIWGFVGTKYARFGSFLHPPKVALAYLLALLHKTPYPINQNPGHNPAAGWSIILMLGLLLLQASSGLFAEDNSYLTDGGPLAWFVSSKVQSLLTQIHQYSYYILVFMIALHIAFIGIHWLYGDNLLAPMVHGKKQLFDKPLHIGIKKHKLSTAIICFLISALIVTMLVNV